MRFSATAIALAATVPALVSAVDHSVNVGGLNSTLIFDPPTTVADVGDTVTFVFQSKNHSVVQSTFPNPCTRSNANGTEGFSSDFKPVSGDGSQLPSFQINVTQSAPIWFYCAQKIPVDHCGMGMVGAINPPPDKTIDQFKAAAMATNGTSTNTTASGTGTGTGSAPSTTPSGGAMRLSGGAAGVLTLFGLVAGLAL